MPSLVSAPTNVASMTEKCWTPRCICTTTSFHRLLPSSTNSSRLNRVMIRSSANQSLVSSMFTNHHLYHRLVTWSLDWSLGHLIDWSLDCSSNYQLTEELHRHGINCRHAGRVRQHCTTAEARAILLTEVCANIKNDIGASALGSDTRDCFAVLLDGCTSSKESLEFGATQCHGHQCQ
jgi:hypothetical protein